MYCRYSHSRTKHSSLRIPTQNSASALTATADQIEVPDFIRDALSTIPPRPYTDSLVQNFFENVNYHYGTLHQPSFMSSYVEWWGRRRQFHRSPNMTTIVTTCLVLRICANSAQYLDSELTERFETELSDSTESLSLRYQTAAQTLSDFIPPGEGDLSQVQQLFLSAIWLKAEAEFAKSWHALAAAIRVAQELSKLLRL